MMEAPRAGPAVGAGIDGLVSVRCLDAFQALDDQSQRFVPGYGYEGVCSTPFVRTLALAQITSAHMRLLDAQWVAQQSTTREST